MRDNSPYFCSEQSTPREEVSRTSWEELADEPADAVEHLVIPDPEGGEALGGLEGLWPGIGGALAPWRLAR